MPNDLDFLDDRTDAQNRGFTQHDTLSFMGRALSPMTTGTLSILDQTGNKLLVGADAPFFDAAAFVLIHQADETDARAARAAAWSGRVVWNEYVFQFMQSIPEIQAELANIGPTIKRMIEDYYKIVAVPAGGSAKKKPAHGRRAGSRGSARS